MTVNSAVVDYRTAVVNAITTTVTGLNHVNWYDAVFDEDDVKEWSMITPCAFVAVRDTKLSMYGTGQMNAALDMAVVVVTADVGDRDSDLATWSLIEQIAILVNYNRFGVDTAAEPDNMSMSRLREPELRKMGVALGIVEWTTGLLIGTNNARADWYYTNPTTGQLILDAPTQAFVATAATLANGTTSHETTVLNTTTDVSGPLPDVV